MSSIFDQHLDKNPANFVALSPTSFVERSAEVFGQQTEFALIQQLQRVDVVGLGRERGGANRGGECEAAKGHGGSPVGARRMGDEAMARAF